VISYYDKNGDESEVDDVCLKFVRESIMKLDESYGVTNKLIETCFEIMGWLASTKHYFDEVSIQILKTNALLPPKHQA
jgi:hypothetical protein